MSGDLWWTVACSRNPQRVRLLHPLTFDLDGEPWSIACDGHRLIAVHVDGFDDARAEFSTEEIALWRSWLAPMASPSVSLAKFRAWAIAGLDGEYTCRHCGKLYDHSKYWCDGGPVYPGDAAPVPGVIGGAVVNRRLLSEMIASAPGENVIVQDGATWDAPVRLSGDGWRAVLMPMRWDARDGVPVWRP